MFEDRDGKNCVEGFTRERVHTRPKIFPHDFHLREMLDVALIIGRAISKTIIGIDQRDVIAELRPAVRSRSVRRRRSRAIARGAAPEKELLSAPRAVARS